MSLIFSYKFIILGLSNSSIYIFFIFTFIKIKNLKSRYGMITDTKIIIILFVIEYILLWNL